MGKAAVLKEILEWAEVEPEIISEDKFIYALSAKIDDSQAMSVNAAIWSFLAGCLHGSASTTFKQCQ